MLQSVRRFVTRISGLPIVLGIGVWSFAVIAAVQAQPPTPQPVVEEFVLADTVQPVTEGQLERAIARANTEGAAALLIELNTPGGLVDSMRNMAGAILSSRVPVIIYVAPAGARAGSAGFFLLEAADIAAMAPGTNAGAAHVVFEFGKPDETMTQKVENDAEAFLRSYVSKRNRNVDAAIAAVQSSHSYTAEEALDKHLIDLTASSDTQLIAALNGREITRLDGSKQVLHLAGARIQRFEPTLRENLLGWLVNPNVALLLLVGGALLIYLEFNTPGTIVPGALGTLMVLLAIFALNLLPIRYTAVLLLLAAVVLLVLEAKFGGHGALAIAGIVCLTLGTLTLVAVPDSRTRRESLDRHRRQHGIRRNHRVPCPTRRARAPHQGQARRRCTGRPSRFSHGTAHSRRPCPGRRRNLACGGQRNDSGRHASPGGWSRAVPSQGDAGSDRPAAGA